MRSLRLAVALATLLPAAALAQSPALRDSLQKKLDSLRVSQRIPGLTLGVTLPDGATFALASGESDTSRHVAMRPTDRMLQGSVGKTYVAAVAMQLVHEGKLKLDEKVSTYLGKEPWFNRLPNAADITVRQLMNHTSGLVRYEFNPKFMTDLRANPMREWTHVEQLSYLFDSKAEFAAGQGWDYSDTNYIVLGMIIERLTGNTYYAELRRRFFEPLKLTNTIPSDRNDLPGVVNGYAGPKNELGGYDASIVNGKFAVNPKFEWTGGGIASTADDLSRWAWLLYQGRAFDPSMLPLMLTGVPSRLGANVQYGLGVMMHAGPHGDMLGHSGFFPGYATEVRFYSAHKIAVAIQANVTDPYPRRLVGFLNEVAKTVQAVK
jgi:D-alanyl-D-alanine carboxypeptidase